MNRNSNIRDNHDEGVVVLPEIDIEMFEEADNESDDNPIASKRLKTSISDQALKTLNDLRCNNLLCDAVISVSDACFNVHRAIMSSCSSYFRYVFPYLREKG